MKKRKHKLMDLIKNIKFSGRMLLIYIIGGIIPFVFAMLYVNERSQDIMLEQSKKTQAEEVSLLCSSVKESMNVALDVSQQIYYDNKVREIASRVAGKNYETAEEFNEDCEDLVFIEKYLRYYKDELSDIRIYVPNKTISSNEYISYISDEDKKNLIWYVPTQARGGKPYWSYNQNGAEKKKVLQLTRAIYDKNSNEIGILSIQLGTKKTTQKITKRQTDTLLIYKVNDVLAASFQIDSENGFILKSLRDFSKKKDSKVITNRVKDYLLTYQRICPDDSDVYYTVASVQSYQDLMTNFTKTSIISMGAVFVGLVISVILIAVFSAIFGVRSRKLQQQMHYVATGRYDLVEPIEGNDEVAQLYRELERMMTDIQELTKRVVEEKVQKEKLHTKQKEVEFKMLASQINPHFLYNTLETIRMKAKINRQAEIEELVKMLAKIMRRNIQVSNHMVTLQSEIELIENYLVIQRYRFGDRIYSEVQVDEEVDTTVMVVPLIMQPFVENAYIHGLEAKEDGGLLKIHVMKQEENIVITIEDNGSGMSYYKLGEMRRRLRENDTAAKEHIGIVNVNQRLRILYGEAYGVTLQSRPGEGTCVKICFPADAGGTEY